MAKTKEKTNAQPDEAELLETALGFSCKEIQIGGETVIVRKFKLRHVAEVLQSVRELEKQLKGELGEAAVGKLMVQFPSITAKWASFATGKPVEWIEDQDLEEATALIGAAVEVNRRFFTGETMTPIYEVIGAALGMVNAKASPETTT